MRSIIPLLIFTAATVACSDSRSGDTSGALPTTHPSAVSPSATNQKVADGRRTDTPVTSDLGGPGNQIEGDGTPYVNGVNGVSSIIQTSNTCCNDWLLDTTTSAHGIRIDLGNSAGGQNPFASSIVTPADGGIIAQCHLAYPASFPGMTVGGGPYMCPMVVHFHSSDAIGDGGNTYWHLGLGGNGTYYPNAPGTGLVAVNCTASDSGGCNAWTITASNQQAVLQREGKTAANFGNFVLNFSFTVTK